MLDRILGKDLAHYVRAHRALLFCSMGFTAIAALFVVIPAYLLQPFIDEGMKAGTEPASWKIPWISIDFQNGFSWTRTERVLIDHVSANRLLAILSVVAFLSILFKSFATYLSQLAAAAFSNRAIRSLRVDLFEKFLSLPLGFYHKRKAGELLSRSTADLTVMQERIANILIGLVEHPLSASAFVIYVLVMNFRLTLLLIVAVPLIVGMIRLFGRKVKKHSTRVQDAVARVTAAYQESILCLKVVQGFCMAESESERFRKLANDLYKNVMRWNRWSIGLSPLMDATGFLVLPAVLIVGKLYFHHSLGELVSLIYAYSRVYAPIKNLAKVNNELRTLQGATERVFGIMKMIPDIRDGEKGLVLSRHSQSIVFNRVDFAYEPGIPVLQEISFKANAGEMIAFVGSTGAGKSTLLDLIPRFYDVTQGSIAIDGIDIRDMTIESLRRQISMVNQDILLFHDTIANNIRYGNPRRSMEEVIEAASLAHAHDFITAQPAGYESVVGDRGLLLSGGQRQRIALARAILAGPSILILDEAASALDAESEKLVEASIDTLRGEMTIFVAAHRLSTIRKADRIYVLEGGRIVESGSQEDLMALNGRFRQFHDIQFKA
jgi:subfamily B ATP-binding cassette protein MsbA